MLAYASCIKRTHFKKKDSKKECVEGSMDVPGNFELAVACDPDFQLWDVYSQKLKLTYEIGMCLCLSVSALLFTRVKIWNRQRNSQGMNRPGMVVQVFNPSTQRQMDLCE